MNLIFRLLYVLLTVRFRGRLDPLDESVVPFRVLPNDLDFNLHMNNGRYLTLMDLGRVDLLIRCGVVREIRRRRWGAVVASLTVRFRRSLTLFQRFEIRTRLVGWDERYFFLEQRCTRRDEVMATAMVKARFLDARGGLDPQVLVDALGGGRESPPIPPGVREWQEAEFLIGGKREFTRDTA